jgi:poly-beta-1,6-N-acetyl-D-glucosamine synthase
MLNTDSQADTTIVTARGSYVLMTAAYNEAAHIEKTLQAVLSQTVLPARWVIVSDGSTDETDEIITRYAEQHDFIRFLRRSRVPGHSFGSKVVALQAGWKLLEDVPSDFIGNIDADLSIAPHYFERLISKCLSDPTLGLTGGFVFEETNGEFQSRKTNRRHSVAHAAQLVRRECYLAIGGYQVLEYGGEDWHAQISAEMRGWRSEAFPDLPIYHHRHTGMATNRLRSHFRLGRLDYSFGSDPWFELIKCFLRFRNSPVILGALVRLAGFGCSYLQGKGRPVSDQFVTFLRRQQRSRMFSPFASFAQGGD